MNEDNMIVSQVDDSLMSLDVNNVLSIADRADKMVTAMNKIMEAAVKITTPRDWVLIGGTPYLQETGATKVARLFGIGWKIIDTRCEYDAEGYPTYTYRIEFSMGNARIECDGSRSAKDEFFAGAKVNRDGTPRKQKSPDEIDIRDVKQAAYTNCLNNGIKRILPGLRNLDVSTLEKNGIGASALRGYTFKDGSRGGNTGRAEDSGIVCECCGAPITQKVASFSQSRFGKKLCMACQKKPQEEDMPPIDDRDAPPERR